MRPAQPRPSSAREGDATTFVLPIACYGEGYKPLGPARQDKMKRRFVLCHARPPVCGHFSRVPEAEFPRMPAVSLFAASTRCPFDLLRPRRREPADGSGDRERPDQGIADAEDGHGESGGMRIRDAGGEQRQFVIRPGRSSLVSPQCLRDGGLVHRTGIARLHRHPDPIGGLDPERHSLSSPFRT